MIFFQLIDASGADVLEKKLQCCAQVDVFDKCGHVVSMDRPYYMSQAILKFREYAGKKSQ